MALSDRKILKARERGLVTISPFHRARLNTSSYDVSLGPWFFREQHPELPHAFLNIYNPGQVLRAWGEPLLAETAADLAKMDQLHPSLVEQFEPHERLIVIAPGETILGHTVEYIGGSRKYTTEMRARSTFGRLCISVCKCAGWGDVGYINRWTMEITNSSRFYSIPLLAGQPIAQIIFIRTGKIADREYGETGNYQAGTSLEELEMIWTADSMRPRLKRKPCVLT